MLVTIHQPNYLPWPGFFNKWMQSDAFVILDTVQFHKNDWQNRNRIKSINGASWLSVPVHFHFPDAISEVQIADMNWAKKQMSSIRQSYAKAPFFAAYWPEIEAILSAQWRSLRDMNMALIRLLGRMLGCHAPLYMASDLPVTEQDPTMRLIALCRLLQADGYLSGSEGRNYLLQHRFREHDIALWFQHATAPVYPQLHGDFIPYLSVIDLLFNVGDEATKTVREMGGKVR